MLRDKERCYLCLPGHCAHECEKGILCRWSNYKHHQSICPKASKTPRKDKIEQTQQQKAKDEKKEIQNLTTTTTSNSSSEVLLQTGTTYAYSKQGNTAILVRVLLDSGSQRSYTTNHRKNRLGLQPVNKGILIL